MNKSIRRIIAILLVFLINTQLLFVYGAEKDPLLREKFTYGSSKNSGEEYSKWLKYKYYSEISAEYEKNGYKPGSGPDIVIDAKDIKIDDNKLKLESNMGGKSTPVFVWEQSVPYVQWDFNIVSQGLYEIEVEYYMLPGSGNPAARSMQIDGQIPFIEAGGIVFPRMWKDEGEPLINSIGDETRPGQVEIQAWQKTKLMDGQGHYALPFRFYLKPGAHSLRLDYVDQSMAISKVRILPAEDFLSYDQVKEQYGKKGYKEASKSIEFEAESNAIAKSDPTIRRETNGDPLCQPYSSTNRKLNVLGGNRWRRGNQSITWKFTVPEDGLYKIGIRELQTWNDGIPSYRQIAIDGTVPFKELLEYRFDYNRKWNLEVLRDKKDSPYLFYLTKGDHTISMTVKMGSLIPIIQTLNSDSVLLSSMITDIIKVTGSEPDPNYDYEFFETIPNLKGDMETLIDSMQKKYEMIKGMSDKLPSMANNFLTIKAQLSDMVKNPFNIARDMKNLTNAQTSLGSWYISLQSQPLLIDYIKVGAPGEKWKNPQSNIFQRIGASIQTFLISFKKDYNNIGSVVKGNTEIKSTINVWIARGTEWAELIKEMADEEFTPKTGILVNMNVLPANQLAAGNVNALMMSITSGKAPDVGLGVGSNDPVEFAIRDTVVDLSKFSDFDDVSKRFLNNIFVPYRYRGGVYALPETMDFSVLFYRKDIVSDLGISLPNTREELYTSVLPTLYQNGMKFIYPQDFTQFIFQHGGDYYTSDGKRTALDTPEAFRAFQEYTELFTSYGVPAVGLSFFTRFRSGEIPMGIGNYNLFMQLSVAAPELAGRWGIAPLPGTKLPNGTVDRSNGALAGQCDIILKQSTKQEESWEFLKWWSSTAVQTKFARELEALVGSEARWNTANVDAFTSLSWKKEDINVIKEQWKWAKEIPVVLGGYFTGRYITNAWNSVVISGENMRDTLENAVKEINRELRMKQEEYGIFDNQR